MFAWIYSFRNNVANIIWNLQFSFLAQWLIAVLYQVQAQIQASSNIQFMSKLVWLVSGSWFIVAGNYRTILTFNITDAAGGSGNAYPSIRSTWYHSRFAYLIASAWVFPVKYCFNFPLSTAFMYNLFHYVYYVVYVDRLCL